MLDTLKGQLLIASPKLRDPNFFRAVILLVQHDEKGSLGLVLNKPMEMTVRSAWRQLSQTPCQMEGHLHKGGPCDGVLMALHTDVEASDVEVIDGVHFSTAKDAIEHLVGQAGGTVRLFVGYAGWSAGQLEGEIAEGAWLTIPATHPLVFNPDEHAWPSLLRSIARDSMLKWMDPKIVPDDPSMN
ncbi:MAG TPA: YqgE/AlgH family protein [Tepidisphaeraceae bacterium]|nr:YqgE/AlgH family protein [Tepidisphaeraceae bacterium]